MNTKEDHVEELRGTEANAKIKALAERARTCLFTTNLGQYPHNTRPMALQEVDAQGTLWFLSAADSRKNHEVQTDDRTHLTFQNDAKYEYLSIFGRAKIHRDRATIERVWTDFARAWFEGKDDPRVTVISVTPDNAYYWETKEGKIIAMAKMTWAMLTGQPNDSGGREGALTS